MTGLVIFRTEEDKAYFILLAIRTSSNHFSCNYEKANCHLAPVGISIQYMSTRILGSARTGQDRCVQIYLFSANCLLIGQIGFEEHLNGLVLQLSRIFMILRLNY